MPFIKIYITLTHLGLFPGYSQVYLMHQPAWSLPRLTLMDCYYYDM